MPRFSLRSLANYATLHADLQKVCDEAIRITDFAVIWGHRAEGDQNRAFAEKTSKLKWPDSRHNTLPSEAMDLLPTPNCGWGDRERFTYLAGIILATAAALGIPLRWGGNWDGDEKILEKNENDLAHFELITRSPQA